MRVLFIPLALASHYYPMVPLAWAMRSAGHEVRIAAQPPVHAQILMSGLPGVAVGASVDLMAELEQTEAEFQRRTGKRLADFDDFSAMPADARADFVDSRHAVHLRAASAIATDVLPFARVWRPDLVITDIVTVAGPLVAGALGVQLVQHSWGPQYPSTAGQPGFGSPVDSWPASLRKLFDRFGVPPLEIFGLCTVDPCPPTLQPWRVPGQFTARYVPYNGAGTVPDWATRPARKPRVCVTWGISNVGMLGLHEHPVRGVIRELSTMDIEVVVSVRSADRAAVGELPDGVHIAEELPLQLLLPGCVAAVHHGGSGTALTVAAYGVPQVILPQEPSGVFTAELLASAGAGIGFPAGHASDDLAGEVTEAVASMLEDDSRLKAAVRLREENDAQPSPAETVRAIEQLLIQEK